MKSIIMYTVGLVVGILFCILVNVNADAAVGASSVITKTPHTGLVWVRHGIRDDTKTRRLSFTVNFGRMVHKNPNFHLFVFINGELKGENNKHQMVLNGQGMVIGVVYGCHGALAEHFGGTTGTKNEHPGICHEFPLLRKKYKVLLEATGDWLYFRVTDAKTKKVVAEAEEFMPNVSNEGFYVIGSVFDKNPVTWELKNIYYD